MLVTVWVNGPLGIFLPATYEPILMVFGRLYPPVVVGAVGIAGTLYVEFLNYHLHRRLLRTHRLRGIRESRTVRWIMGMFNRAPFFTIWLCSWSPLPYWAVRILGPLADYPVRRYLLATLLGRFPRFWFFAALGVWWQIPLELLAAITAASIVAGLVVWAVKARGWRDTPVSLPKMG